MTVQGTQNNPRLAALGWELQEQMAGTSLVVQWLESTCQRRGHRFSPWSGKVPQAMEQLSQYTTSTGPACLQPVLHNKRSRHSEEPARGK